MGSYKNETSSSCSKNYVYKIVDMDKEITELIKISTKINNYFIELITLSNYNIQNTIPNNEILNSIFLTP